jgi:hypothetical protein
MRLARYLAYGEEVLVQSGQFYATSTRVIHLQEKENGQDEVRSLPYSSLATVELVSKPRHLIMLAGTAVAILALPLFFYLYLSPILVLLGGIGLVIYGAMERETYYQLRAHSMTEQEVKLWRIPRKGGGQLAATIRYMIGDRLE